jgi:hypothetical protein
MRHFETARDGKSTPFVKNQQNHQHIHEFAGILGQPPSENG